MIANFLVSNLRWSELCNSFTNEWVKNKSPTWCLVCILVLSMPTLNDAMATDLKLIV